MVGGVHGWELCPSQKRGLCVGKTKKAKGTKWMVVVDGQGVPVGSQLCSASPAEVKLADSTLRCCPARLQRRIRRVVADKAYDSDGLDRQLMRRGIELIAPHKETANGLPPRTRGACADTASVGKSNARSLGWATTAAWSSAGTVPSSPTKPSSIWLVS
jgi:hypothetical protein